MSGPVVDGGYREQLSVPWWSHLVVLVISVTLGLESSFLAGGLKAQAVVVLVFALVGELAVWRYGSRVIEVQGGYLRAGRWRLPIAQVRAVAVLDAAATRRELHSGDTEVYRCTRSWVPGAVLLDVDDPEDLPLWLVSTRHPHLFAAALADAASAEPGPGPDASSGSTRRGEVAQAAHPLVPGTTTSPAQTTALEAGATPSTAPADRAAPPVSPAAPASPMLPALPVPGDPIPSFWAGAGAQQPTRPVAQPPARQPIDGAVPEPAPEPEAVEAPPPAALPVAPSGSGPAAGA